MVTLANTLMRHEEGVEQPRTTHAGARGAMTSCPSPPIVAFLGSGTQARNVRRPQFPPPHTGPLRPTTRASASLPLVNVDHMELFERVRVKVNDPVPR